MTADTVEPTNYNTTGQVYDGAEVNMGAMLIDHNFAVDRKPTEKEVQMYKEALYELEFRDTLWMNMAVSKFWNGFSSTGIAQCSDIFNFCRFPFLWLLAMSLMVYFPLVLIIEYWPTGIQCLQQRHSNTIVLASEAIIIYLFSMTGFNRWTMSDDDKELRNKSTRLLFVMLSSHSTRHKWVIILGHITTILCSAFLIPATAWSLIYNDPELENILIRGVEMHFLMEVPHVLGFISEERMVHTLVTEYGKKGAKVANYVTWEKQNKWLVRIIMLLEYAAMIWSVFLPIAIGLCM